MNIYLVDRRGPIGYDTYSCFVVVSKSEADARMYHPSGKRMDAPDVREEDEGWSWTTDQQNIAVKLIGTAAPEFTEGEIICADFNAG